MVMRCFGVDLQLGLSEPAACDLLALFTFVLLLLSRRSMLERRVHPHSLRKAGRGGSATSGASSPALHFVGAASFSVHLIEILWKLGRLGRRSWCSRVLWLASKMMSVRPVVCLCPCLCVCALVRLSVCASVCCTSVYMYRHIARRVEISIGRSVHVEHHVRRDVGQPLRRCVNRGPRESRVERHLHLH